MLKFSVKNNKIDNKIITIKIKIIPIKINTTINVIKKFFSNYTLKTLKVHLKSDLQKKYFLKL